MRSLRTDGIAPKAPVLLGGDTIYNVAFRVDEIHIAGGATVMAIGFGVIGCGMIANFHAKAIGDIRGAHWPPASTWWPRRPIGWPPRPAEQYVTNA